MAGEKVSGLKVLKNYLYADVRIGFDKAGEVTNRVRVNVGDPEVIKALEPLYALLRQRSAEAVTAAMVEVDIQQARDLAYFAAKEQAEDRINRNLEHVVRQAGEAIQQLKLVGPLPQHGDDPRKWDRIHGARKLRDALSAVIGF